MLIDEVHITADDFVITDAIKDLILKKYQRLLKNYGRFITEVDVVLKSSNETSYIAETNVTVRNKFINASAKTDDMYKLIDEMLHKLKVQLEKYKEIQCDHHAEDKRLQIED